MKTVRIIVCDDEKAVREILSRKIEKLCEEKSVPYQIVCLGSGEEVLCQKQAPDILFLDIQMPGKSGMEIAGQLRGKHWRTILIFVTALSEYVYEAFDVGAFHYLVKPFRDDKLREVLGRALQQYVEQQRPVYTGNLPGGERKDGGLEIQGSRTGQFEGNAQAYEVDGRAAILVKRGGISTKVPLEDIIYAEVFNRKVMLHTVGGDIEYYGRLTDLSGKAGADFYRTHRSYLVNFKYVEKYTATTIWLEQGTALVSKKQFAGFVKQYMQYISRKRGG